MLIELYFYIICRCRYLCISTLITMSLQLYIFHSMVYFFAGMGLGDCFLKCEKLKKKKSEQFLHCKKITVWKCYSKNLLDG